MKDKIVDTMITKFKINVRRYGIPLEVIKHNGPQFTSDIFKRFPKRIIFHMQYYLCKL